MIRVVYPRWLFPNNLGDSAHTTFVPKFLRRLHPSEDIVFVSYGKDLELAINSAGFARFEDPTNQDLNYPYGFYRDAANEGLSSKKTYYLFPEWHPNIWTEWNKNFDKYYEDPNVNILVINSLLQLGLLDKWDFEKDSGRPIIPRYRADKTEELAIVPATKLAGRPTPHPGCDGKGLRFNGDNGESWKKFVGYIRSVRPDIKIVEFSYENFGLGDRHVPHTDWKNLATECSKPKVAVLSDGGLHHIFNSQETPVVLLGAWKIDKPYLTKLGNGIFYEDLHSECLDRCGPYIRNSTGLADASKNCNYSCEKLDPILLAKRVLKDFYS
jgi:hypothetical protein